MTCALAVCESHSQAPLGGSGRVWEGKVHDGRLGVVPHFLFLLLALLSGGDEVSSRSER